MECNTQWSNFWNRKSFWNSNFQINVYFSKTVLVWIPCAIFLLYLFCSLIFSCSYSMNLRRVKKICACKFCRTRLICVCILFILSLFRLIGTVLEANIWGTFDNKIKLLTLVMLTECLFALISLTKRDAYIYDSILGTPQLLTLAAFVFCGLLELCVYLYLLIWHLEHTIIYDVVVYTFQYIGFCIATILFSISHYHDSDSEKFGKLGGDPWPEKRLSISNRLFFIYFWGFLIKGYKNILQLKDLWRLDKTDETETVYSQFIFTYREFKVYSKLYPALVLALSVIKANWKLLLVTIILTLLRIGVSVGVIYLIRTLIEFSTNAGPQWHGIFYISLLFFLLLIRGLCLQHKNYITAKIGIRIRSALALAITKKSLMLSFDVRRQFSSGEIINLVTSDANRFLEHTFLLHVLLSVPFQICVGAYILYGSVGNAMWFGMGVVVLSIIISYICGIIYQRFFEEQIVYRDDRIRFLLEVLQNIRIVKFFAWEPAFQKFLNNIRNREMKKIKSSIYPGTAIDVVYICTTLIACMAIFGAYVVITQQTPTPEIIFVVITVFRFLFSENNNLVGGVYCLTGLIVSFKRIGNFLIADEYKNYVQQYSGGNINEQGLSILVDKCRFCWGSKSELFTIDNINLQFQSGKLIAIIGAVGSGKSSLINAMAGEMHLNSGSIKIWGKVAYVPQQAWILNDRVRNNILLGQSYEKAWYDKVISACALLPDFETLPAGDMTEIGERGVNLSGGQKLRISLARAVYQNNDIYFLDDPLSAVDVHVKNHLFDKVIGPSGLLNAKTRIFVTNTLSYLPRCDEIIILDRGKIIMNDSYENIAKNHLHLFSEIETKNYINEDRIEKLKPGLEIAVLEQIDLNPNVETNELFGQLIETETMNSGKVTWDAYWLYCKAAGWPLLAATILIIISYACEVGSFIWIEKWIDNPLVVSSGAQNLTQRQPSGISNGKGLTIIGVFVAIQIGFCCFYLTCAAIFPLRASRFLHDKLLEKILKAPTSFFDVTPIGRIVNRCGRDMTIIDQTIYDQIGRLQHYFAASALGLVPSLYTTPVLIIIIIPAIIVFILIQRFYIVTGRQCQRLEAISRSSIFSQLNDILHGIENIRIYKLQHQFCLRFNQLYDVNTSAYMALLTSLIWLSFNLEIICHVVLITAAGLVIFTPGITPGQIGLSLSVIMAVSDVFMFGVICISELEVDMIAVERVSKYYQLPSEDDWENGKCEADKDDKNVISNLQSDKSWRIKNLIPKVKSTYGTFMCNQKLKRHRLIIVNHKNDEETKNLISLPPLTKIIGPKNENWIKNGQIEFRNYSLRYRPNLPLSLKNLSFIIKGGEKIGIVGRTGAGKTSLSLGLFRLIEPASGSILIDSIDISTLGLHKLRRQLTIIPQDPALFSGTLRRNLDPFEEYSDDQIWKALEQSHLKAYVSLLPEKLENRIESNGSNLSVGQRQMVCLARALLRKTKILILDEATASVDLETDKLIQKTIRSQFLDCTVVTIAHRLETIMDYDSVALLSNGQLIEHGYIGDLLLNDESKFRQMAVEAGLI